LRLAIFRLPRDYRTSKIDWEVVWDWTKVVFAVVQLALILVGCYYLGLGLKPIVQPFFESNPKIGRGIQLIFYGYILRMYLKQDLKEYAAKFKS
jgi:hypothetical protein